MVAWPCLFPHRCRAPLQAPAARRHPSCRSHALLRLGSGTWRAVAQDSMLPGPGPVRRLSAVRTSRVTSIASSVVSAAAAVCGGSILRSRCAPAGPCRRWIQTAPTRAAISWPRVSAPPVRSERCAQGRSSREAISPATVGAGRLRQSCRVPLVAGASPRVSALFRGRARWLRLARLRSPQGSDRAFSPAGARAVRSAGLLCCPWSQSPGRCDQAGPSASRLCHRPFDLRFGREASAWREGALRPDALAALPATRSGRVPPSRPSALRRSARCRDRGSSAIGA